MIRAIRVDDFTGGLNLEANIFQLAKNESGDLLNVDINPKGGVSMRNAFIEFHSSAIGSFAAGAFDPQRLFGWQGSSRQLLLAANNKVFYATTGNFSPVQIGGVDIVSDNTYGAWFSSWTRGSDPVLYISRGPGYAITKWTGTVATALTTSGPGKWQNDLTNPNGTHAPKGQYVATHAERLWVANVTEQSTVPADATYPNRVRFSHPLFPESWREDDYIDIPGGGPEIVGIVPFAGHLLVFKQRAVFAIYGYSEDTFQVVELTRSVGAVNANAIAFSDSAVYFFSGNDGVIQYDGRGFRNIFGKLRRLILDAEVNEEVLNKVSLGYSNRKVVLSLPIGVEGAVGTSLYDASTIDYDDVDFSYLGATRSTKVTKAFVWDGAVGKDGAWTVWETADGYGLVGATDFTDDNGVRNHVFAHPYQPKVVRMDVYGQYKDLLNGIYTSYSSYYVTPWEDAGNVSAFKFWRRPDVVLRQESSGTTVTVDVYHNWDQWNEVKSFSISQSAFDGGGSQWESWNDPDWGAKLERADSLGLARAVQMRISGDGSNPWYLNSLGYKFNPRKIKV